MQKPEKKSIKDFILEKTATELQFPQEVVDRVIGWSYKKANDATHTNKEVEISGIGKLQLSQSKLRKNIDKLEKIAQATKDPEMEQSVRERLEDLKTKRDV